MATTPERLSCRDVLGVPRLPPAGLTAGATRVREVFRRAWSAMAPPPVRILEGGFGLLDHRVLVALCDADIPDHLTGTMSIDDLARRSGADDATLDRLVRYASTRGWVGLDRRGRVKPNRVTEFLRTDHPGGWRSWIDFIGGEEIVTALAAFDARTGIDDAFAAANGQPFFEWMADHPERHEAFDRAMAAGARMHALGLDQVLDWDGVTKICDVGGGTGDLLVGLLGLHPHLEGILLDIPAVVARASVHPRLLSVGGDAFEEVPAGCDRYLLVNVVHDWGDSDAARILGAVGAAGDAAEVVIVDGARTAVPHDPISPATDVLMAALTPGGMERGTDAMVALGRSAGLQHLTSHDLPSGDLAHIFRTPSGSRGTLAP